MRKSELLILVVSIVASYLLIFFLDIGCPINKIFGIECAGCGLTRMFLSIFKFNFYQAFRFNPCMFILLVFFILYFVYVIVCKLLHKKYFKLGFKTAIVIVVLIIGFGILRNINGFEFLKPTIVK